MPTGYTADVIEKDISFREFALKCMRAFGPLITFRDEEMNKVFTEVPLSPHYKTSFDGAERELAEFESKDHAELQNEAVAAICRSAAQKAKFHADAEQENARLNRMIAEVERWEPPTSEHVRYKEFMLDQLKISLNDLSYYKTDAPDTSPGEVEAWIANRRPFLANNVQYYAEELEKARKRNTEANAWIKAVVDSLPQEVIT